MRTLDLRARLCLCHRHLKHNVAFPLHMVVMSLVTHSMFGFRRLRDCDCYVDDSLVRRLLGPRRSSKHPRCVDAQPPFGQRGPSVRGRSPKGEPDDRLGTPEESATTSRHVRFRRICFDDDESRQEDRSGVHPQAKGRRSYCAPFAGAVSKSPVVTHGPLGEQGQGS